MAREREFDVHTEACSPPRAMQAQLSSTSVAPPPLPSIKKRAAQPQPWYESTAGATCEGHPPNPHWRLAAKLPTLRKNSLPTPLQAVLDTELYKAEVLLKWAKAEQVRKGRTLGGICARMACYRHEEGCDWDPPCALEGCTRPRQYPEGCAWDRCCKECCKTDGSAHDSLVRRRSAF